ncbi:MAG: imidazoleglycerol-phosphate dehydratase HisB [Oscillospiraceae bacterium]|nr:imidazoleglycerol-phosphate dehydratase HisB [Oscillospiraceae bacterium]
MRKSIIKRTTNETDITLHLDLDGSGKSGIETGCGFLNHMLTLFAAHGGFDLDVTCGGDTDVDYHHSVEDVGICLGKAFAEAVGDMKGIRRYADVTLPMDEALVLCAVDVSGRSFFVNNLQFSSEKIGEFDTELVNEFFTAFTRCAHVTLHLRQICGVNSHHVAEAAFKAFARALKKAVTIMPDRKDQIPSTKGVL